MEYDDDDYSISVDTLYSSVDYFNSLDDDERDQYDDFKQIALEELESRLILAEEQILAAYKDGADSNHLERLEDERELLLMEYNRYEPEED